MDKSQHPEPLSFLSENWQKWKRFELYMASCGNDSKRDETKSAILLHVAGAEAIEIYNGFTWAAETDKKKIH